MADIRNVLSLYFSRGSLGALSDEESSVFTVGALAAGVAAGAEVAMEETVRCLHPEAAGLIPVGAGLIAATGFTGAGVGLAFELAGVPLRGQAGVVP